MPPNLGHGGEGKRRGNEEKSNVVKEGGDERGGRGRNRMGGHDNKERLMVTSRPSSTSRKC